MRNVIYIAVKLSKIEVGQMTSYIFIQQTVFKNNLVYV